MDNFLLLFKKIVSVLWFPVDIFSHLDISHIVEEMAYVYVVACTLYMHKIWSKDL